MSWSKLNGSAFQADFKTRESLRISGGATFARTYSIGVGVFLRQPQRRHLGGLGAVAPPPSRKKKKRKKERKKEKKKKKKKKKKKEKKGTMSNFKLLHIKCCFFQFFNSPVALKNKKNVGPPRKS